MRARIDQDCVEFMLGHLSGIGSVGGTHDKTPELYAEVIEREYAKLEPYINVYSGKVAESLRDEFWQFMTRLIDRYYRKQQRTD